MREVRDHSASMVLTLAFALCGGGQLMNGQWAKGFLFVALVAVLAVLAGTRGDARFFLVSVALWLTALVDAVLIGRRIAHGEAVGPWSWFRLGG
ncbi:MAG: hypothetical protein ACKO5K_03870 [Armatimonadota bacterium]